MDIPVKKLNNGVEIPMLGLGVFQSREGREAVNAVRWAIEAGLRHIDTAAAYGNESSVAEGIRQSGVERKDVFITTKLWTDDMRSGKQRAALLRSLDKLNTDYVDLYLLHWPTPDYFVESWQVLVDLYREGLIRAIGVSNFQPHHLDALTKVSDIVPAVNQIELHPYLSQVALCAECENRGIAPEAWSPLGHGAALKDETIAAIAQGYGKSVAQIIIRWELQRGIITIPKSVHHARIMENADVFDFELSEKDIKAINGLNRNHRTGPDPDNFPF